jgi:4-amino-4-deoxy-L-arabinose transferase-like glycosyltransferase
MTSRERQLLLGVSFICAPLLYIYPLALDTPLLDPDEGQHASITLGMVDTGDYVVPRYLGEPFLDKPILYFAAQAASLRLLGTNEAAVRLPGLLFALLGVLTTYLLARRLFDSTTAMISSLIALTLIGPLAMAQAAAHDVSLVPWTTLLLLCFWNMATKPTEFLPVRDILLVAILVAMALLAKGVIGLAVVGVGAVVYAIVMRQLTIALVVRCLAGIVVGAAIASPWFIAMEIESPGYLLYYFVERHVMGFATSSQRHGSAPWYYYMPILVIGALPWTMYAIHGAWHARSERRETPQHRPILFVVCWLLGGLLFLSIAGSKLLTYCLPVFPAVAILAAVAVTRFIQCRAEPRQELVTRWAIYSMSVVGFVAPIVGIVVMQKYLSESVSVGAVLLAGTCSVLSIAAVVLLRREYRVAAVATTPIWIALMFVILMTWPGQTIAEHFSQRSLARHVDKDALPPGAEVWLVGERVSSIAFYLNPQQRGRYRQGDVKQIGMHEVENWSVVPSNVLLAITDNQLDSCRDRTILRDVDLVSVGHFHVLKKIKPVDSSKLENEKNE